MARCAPLSAEACRRRRAGAECAGRRKDRPDDRPPDPRLPHVAFPQSGLLLRPGTLELLETALRNGADIVGGLDPSGIDRDPKGHLDAVFGLCQRHGKPLDIHLHEPGELGAFAMELIIERTLALGMQGKVVVSHAFCLGDVARAPALYEALGQARARHRRGRRRGSPPPCLACRARGCVR